MSGFVTVKHAVNKNFTTIDNVILRDARLSWKATGLLVWLLHLSPDWKLYVSSLGKFKKDGAESTRSGLQELIDLGYVSVITKKEGGRFCGTEWIVTDRPETPVNRASPPRSGNPHTVELSAANQTLIKTNKTKTKNNKYLKNPAATAGDFFEPGFLYAVKKQNEDDEAVLQIIKKCSKDEIVLAQQRLGPRRGCFPSYLLGELKRFAVSLQPQGNGKKIGHRLTPGRWGGFDEKNYLDGVNADGSF